MKDSNNESVDELSSETVSIARVFLPVLPF
jgi:hypothetical protein